MLIRLFAAAAFVTCAAPGSSFGSADAETSGNERPSFGCMGKAATLVGTVGVDRLRAGAGRDVIAGLAGSDRISNVGREDLVCAGGGRDRVVAQPRPSSEPRTAARAGSGGGGIGYVVLSGGADALAVTCQIGESYPSGSFNQVEGGPGDDRLESDCPFHDTMDGGPGDDVIRIGLGRDTAVGGDGDDKLIDAHSVAGDCERDEPKPPLEYDFGFPDRRCVQLGPISGAWYDFEDSWWGGEGDDVILGGAANDLVAGEQGDDRLEGGPGGDAVSGGPDQDRCDGGDGQADTNSGEGYLPLDDCEHQVGFEPFGDPEFPPPPPPRDCDRAADPAGYEQCLRLRPWLHSLFWSPPELDVSEAPGEIWFRMFINDPEPGEPDWCFHCSPMPSLASVVVTARSSGGDERTADIPCSPPEGDDQSFYGCDGAFTFDTGSPSDTWSLVSVRLFDETGHWSHYTADDLADPNLFPQPQEEPYETWVSG